VSTPDSMTTLLNGTTALLAAVSLLLLSACEPPAPEQPAEAGTEGETQPATDPGQSAETDVPPPLPEIDPTTLPEVQAELGVAPQAAPPTNRSEPARVVVELEVIERTGALAERGLARAGNRAGVPRGRCP